MLCRPTYCRSNYSGLATWYDAEPYPGHIREYTLDEVKKMLRWAEFDIKLAKLTNSGEISIVKKSKSRPFKLIASLYLLVTTIIPSLRYEMILVGQKG